MATSDHHAQVVSRLRLAGDGGLPAPIGGRCQPGDGLAELDVGAQIELGDVVAEIRQHALMTRIFGIILIEHGQVVEASGTDARDEVGGLVDDAARGGDVPQAADIGLAFETIEGDAPRKEGLGGGQSRRSGADNEVFVLGGALSHLDVKLCAGSSRSFGVPANASTT
jgi:hypothetical protein